MKVLRWLIGALVVVLLTPIPESEAQSCEPALSGTIGWWPLDENQGSTSANLADGPDGVWVGTPDPSVPDHVDGTLAFATGSVEVPHTAALDLGAITGGQQDFTIMMWVGVSLFHLPTLISKQLPNGQGFVVSLDGLNRPQLSITNDQLFTNTYTATSGVPSGVLTHVAVRFEVLVGFGAFVSFYMDGAFAGSTQVFSVLDFSTPGAPLVIGGGTGGLILDEVVISDTAHFQLDILAICAAGTAGMCKNDCNANGVADTFDIQDGLSADCDGNLVPDECQDDCDQDGIPDACDDLCPPFDPREGVALQRPDNVLTNTSANGPEYHLLGGNSGVSGSFQTTIPFVASMNGWLTEDLTEQPTYWQASAFNAANLNNNGAGNTAMWCGQDATQRPGWATPPGYGNNWCAALEFSTPMLSTTVVQTVGLDFYLNYETERWLDKLLVQYQNATGWNTIAEFSGTNSAGGAFPTPGVSFSTWPQLPITYAGGDYGGNANDEVRLRFLFLSNGSGSDEDGLFCSVAGATQIDDISVTWDDGTGSQISLEDFETAGPYAWTPVTAPIVGDFAKAFSLLSEDDACRANATGQLTFIDDGTPPSNGGGASTGGSTSLNWNYGTPGGWVVNVDGGLSMGEKRLHNRAVSPELVWDLPGTQDDLLSIAGVTLRFDVYRHLPLENGILYTWHVRSSNDGGATWEPWRSRDLYYYGRRDGEYISVEEDVTNLFPSEKDRVQVALGVVQDPLGWGFIPADATPGPWFDNVELVKYQIGGPAISARQMDLFQDAFPNESSLAVGTVTERDRLDVRIDAARDLGLRVQGDGIRRQSYAVVDAVSAIPGSLLEVFAVQLFYCVHRNPVFESSIRSALGPPTSLGTGLNGWDVTTGSVVATPYVKDDGSQVHGRMVLDLPDKDFLYPGDVLQYYISATDDQGRTSVLPNNTIGFADGSGTYDRHFTIRALPTLLNTQGETPAALIYNDNGPSDVFAVWTTALQNIGFGTGQDVDIYTTMAATSAQSNGLGAGGHGGATALQLSAYNTIYYEGDELEYFLMNDGNDGPLTDKSDDLSLFAEWLAQSANRYLYVFADDIATSTTEFANGGASFLSNQLGVAQVNRSTVPTLPQATADAPVTTAGAPFFGNSCFGVIGNCPRINAFDLIAPVGGAFTGHDWQPCTGSPTTPSASVIWDRTVGGFRKLAMTFPYGFQFVGAPCNTVACPAKRGFAFAPRTFLLLDLMSAANVVGGSFPTTAPNSPARPLTKIRTNHPNPFNPNTTIHLEVGRRSVYEVAVYDLSGRRVTELHAGLLEQGLHAFDWQGIDHAGRSVSSGVYLVRVEGDGKFDTKKVTLLK